MTTVDTLAKLLDVCGELRASEQVDERAVTGCSFDSRAVSAGDVFFCKGAAFKPAFLSMALDAGAVAFVCEESLVESLEPLAQESGAAMLVVDSVRTAMALLPPEVYDRPDHDVKIVGITGRSGSGKSTLLNIIGLILKPDSGSVAVGGEEVLNMSDRRCSAFRNASFGYIVQDFALLDDETVYHNIRIPLLYNRQIRRREHKPRIREIAQKLDISDKLNRKAGKLSGGERQRANNQKFED